MSVEATWAVWKITKPLLTATEKLILLSYADRAGEDHEAWPSNKRLVLDTCLDTKTISTAIESLVQKGYLIDTDKRAGRTNQIIVYSLPFVQGREKDISLNTTENGSLQNSNRSVFPLKGSGFPLKTPENGSRNQSLEPISRTNNSHTKEISEKNDIEVKNSSSVSVCVNSGLTPSSDEIVLISPRLKNEPRIAISRQTVAGHVIERKYEFTQEDVDIGFADYWDLSPRKSNFPGARLAWHCKRLGEKRIEIMADVKIKIAHDRCWAEGMAPGADTYLKEDGWLTEVQLAPESDTKKFAPTALTPDEKVLVLEYCSFRNSKLEPKKDLQEKIDALKEKIKKLDSSHAREALAQIEKAEEAFGARSFDAVMKEALAAQERIAKNKGADVMREELKNMHAELAKPVKPKREPIEPSSAASNALAAMKALPALSGQMSRHISNKLTTLRENVLLPDSEFFSDEAIEV